MLQFQAASAIQEAIIREYSEYQENDVSVFVEWLIQYCIHHTGSVRFFLNLIVDYRGIFWTLC